MAVSEEYRRLKRKVDRTREEADRAHGAFESKMKDLKEDFDCETIEEAETRLEEMQCEVAELKEKYKAMYDKFLSKWGSVLNGDKS